MSGARYVRAGGLASRVSPVPANRLFPIVAPISFESVNDDSAGVLMNIEDHTVGAERYADNLTHKTFPTTFTKMEGRSAYATSLNIHRNYISSVIET